MSDIAVLLHRALYPAGKRRLSGCRQSRRQRQNGVVLVIALVLLVLMSLLAVTSLRNAGSSESVASNVRTTELATQAADIALRYCEAKALDLAVTAAKADEAVRNAKVPKTDDAIKEITPIPNQWMNRASWDSPDTKPPWNDTSANASAYVLPLELINQTSRVYQRAPECMIEKQVKTAEAGTSSTSSFYVITARGFGPEVVKANPARSRAVGSEVWLQSHVEYQ